MSTRPKGSESRTSSRWKGVVWERMRWWTRTPCAKPERSVSKYQSPSMRGNGGGLVDKNAPYDVHHLHTLGGKVLADGFDRARQVSLFAAGKHINRGVAVLRPGVDHNVGLGDDCDARDALR